MRRLHIDPKTLKKKFPSLSPFSLNNFSLFLTRLWPIRLYFRLRIEARKIVSFYYEYVNNFNDIKHRGIDDFPRLFFLLCTKSNG